MPERIEANYESLDNINKKFVELAAIVDDVMGKISAAYYPIASDGWKGAGFSAFLKESDEEVGPALIRMRDTLQEGYKLAYGITKLLQETDQSQSG